MDADMVNLDREHLSYADAERLADLWNAAHPLMRNLLSAEIGRVRGFVKRAVWEKPVTELYAENIPDYGRSETRTRRRLKYVESLRLELGQLDKGEHRPCTQSPKCFSITAAHSRVTSMIHFASNVQEGMAPVYRLAAVLAEEHDRWLVRMRKR